MAYLFKSYYINNLKKQPMKKILKLCVFVCMVLMCANVSAQTPTQTPGTPNQIQPGQLPLTPQPGNPLNTPTPGALPQTPQPGIIPQNQPGNYPKQRGDSTFKNTPDTGRINTMPTSPLPPK
jgi:hypothetical protein